MFDGAAGNFVLNSYKHSNKIFSEAAVVVRADPLLEEKEKKSKYWK